MLKSKGSVSRIRRKWRPSCELVIVMHNHRVIKDHPREERWMNLSEAFTFYNKVIKLYLHISCPSSCSIFIPDSIRMYNNIENIQHCYWCIIISKSIASTTLLYYDISNMGHCVKRCAQVYDIYNFYEIRCSNV